MTLSHACKINLSQLGHVMKGAHLWECREERNTGKREEMKKGRNGKRDKGKNSGCYQRVSSNLKQSTAVKCTYGSVLIILDSIC